MQYITLLSSDHRVYRKNSTEIPAPYRKKAPNPFGFEVSIIQCRRWAFGFVCRFQVKSTVSGFSIDTIFSKWGKNGANIKITTLNESLETVRSHVGMIIHSTTLDTEEKVIAIYGGTAWSKVEGRFLLGASSSYAVNSTGGEATHKLTTAEMPAHSHNSVTWSDGQKIGSIGNNYGATQTSAGYANRLMAYGADTNGTTITNSTGGNTAHNNMPPYMAVYIWVRTA